MLEYQGIQIIVIVYVLVELLWGGGYFMHMGLCGYDIALYKRWFQIGFEEGEN